MEAKYSWIKYNATQMKFDSENSENTNKIVRKIILIEWLCFNIMNVCDC